MAKPHTFYRPRIAISVDNAPLPQWTRVVIISSAGFSSAIVTVPRPDSLSAGNQVRVGIDTGSGEEPLFSGTISEEQPHHGTIRYLAEPSARQALRETLPASAWRKEQSSRIARDLLESSAHPFDPDLSAWPDVELDRFSIPRCLRHWALQSLEQAVGTAAGVAMGRVSVPDGALRLGVLEHMRRTTRNDVVLETGVNIIHRSGIHVQAFALPVGYNQEVFLDGQKRLCTYSRMDISPGRYRSDLVLETL